VPAWELYDGVAFRVVKRAQRQAHFPTDIDILILSARYGLISPDRQIASYDQRMTRAVVEDQARRNRDLLCSLLRKRCYKEVLVCLGRTYLSALDPFDAWLPDGVPVILAEGGIGRKMQQLKQWLVNRDC
jgi:hypothetical protein